MRCIDDSNLIVVNVNLWKLNIIEDENGKVIGHGWRGHDDLANVISRIARVVFLFKLLINECFNVNDN